jgi:cell division protein ZapE
MKPSRKYQSLLQQPEFVADDAQQKSVALLDDLYDRIVSNKPVSWWKRLFVPASSTNTVTGIYLWGGVGRGKTLLMDLFYQSLPAQVGARRIHFHSFMNQIHSALKQLNTSEPLKQVALDIAQNTRVLCLDEFVIIDIGDAMIMAGLLETLLSSGVILVTTSNAMPQNLYKDGLQRARFLPAIALIEDHCQQVNLDGEQDYRLRFLSQTDLYSVPHTNKTTELIQQYLSEHVSPMQTEQADLVINGRSLSHQFCAEDTVWFSFSELCETTRSQNDYLELAHFFKTLILTDISQMDKTEDDVARRFVLLIDVLYDHQVKLICSAAVRPEELYSGDRLRFEFERTSSRLLEMQSEDYLTRAYTPQLATS